LALRLYEEAANAGELIFLLRQDDHLKLFVHNIWN
jgi:hypothetical protein